MIEKYFVDVLKSKFPDGWHISEDYYEAEDNIIAVYGEGGGEPDPDNEIKPLEPAYMIWLSSSDFATVKKIAYEIFKEFHMKGNFRVTNYDGVEFHVNLIAGKLPNRIGVEGDQLQYSINFETNIREVIKNA